VPYANDLAHASEYSFNGVIESGTAFIVGATQPGSFIVHETDKLNASSTIGIASRPSNNPTREELYTNLLYVNANGEKIMADGVAALYQSGYHNKVDSQDVQKFQSFSGRERITIFSEQNLLSIERRQSINETDTTHILVAVARNTNYQLQFIAKNSSHLFQPMLEDRFTKTSTGINPDGITEYSFITTNDTLSTATNRFDIVFGRTSILPVLFLSAKAWLQNNSTAIQWKVVNEINIRAYTVEKSMDGINFNKVALVPALGINQIMSTYNSIDTSKEINDCYYRICATDSKAALIYSTVVKVQRKNTDASVSIYPNPITNGIICIQFNNMLKGNYDIRVLNSTGQAMLYKRVVYKGGYGIEKLNMGKMLSKGVYQLEIVKPDLSKTHLSVLSEK
jgi:hypothetical protein